MKIRIPKRQAHAPAPEHPALARFCERADRYLPHLRTSLLIAGLLAAALRAGTVADYLFGAGLLLHWAIWFQSWWSGARWER